MIETVVDKYPLYMAMFLWNIKTNKEYIGIRIVSVFNYIYILIVKVISSFWWCSFGKGKTSYFKGKWISRLDLYLITLDWNLISLLFLLECWSQLRDLQKLQRKSGLIMHVMNLEICVDFVFLCLDDVHNRLWWLFVM